MATLASLMQLRGVRRLRDGTVGFWGLTPQPLQRRFSAFTYQCTAFNPDYDHVDRASHLSPGQRTP